MAIGPGVLLPGVAENSTFPILRALAYTTGLGYRPTCDLQDAGVNATQVLTQLLVLTPALTPALR